MEFIVVTKTEESGRVRKYQHFKSRPEAEKFAATVKGARAFEHPGGIDWRIENGVLVKVEK